MKLYIVAFDDYIGDYGANISLYGIYDTKEKAIKRLEELFEKMFVPEDYNDAIKEIELNQNTYVDLGGYIE